MIKLINTKDRNTLCEGRSYQMGFGFAKKMPNDSYKVITPVSACKDFLNDVVWSEATDKPVSIYGLSYHKQDIYDKEYAYIIMSILTNKNGNKYTTYDQDVKRLEENYKRLQSFMNYFEETLTEGVFTEIEKIKENEYLVKVPLIFIKGTYLISLYSLLLRAGQFWNGEQNPQDFMDNFNANLIDVSLVKAAAPKLKKLVENGYIEQDLNKLTSSDQIHNSGIISFKEL